MDHKTMENHLSLVMHHVIQCGDRMVGCGCG